MRKMVPIATGLALAVLISGCAHRKTVGGGPDEFAVARQAPLVIPPDFSLTPPQPGVAPANTVGPSTQALDALFGGAAPRSASESAALSAAGADSADPGIRSAVGDPETKVVDKGATTRDIVAAPEGNGQDASTTTP